METLCYENPIFYIFTGVKLVYNVVLVPAVQQSKSLTCINISTLFYSLLTYRSMQSTEFPVLYSKVLIFYFI